MSRRRRRDGARSPQRGSSVWDGVPDLAPDGRPAHMVCHTDQDDGVRRWILVFKSDEFENREITPEEAACLLRSMGYREGDGRFPGELDYLAVLAEPCDFPRLDPRWRWEGPP